MRALATVLLVPGLACADKVSPAADAPVSPPVDAAAIDALVDVIPDGSVDAAPLCSGPPPALSTCLTGDFFAACGGGGTAVFACSGEDCRWFSSGCVATGFVASDCPSQDVCCHDDLLARVCAFRYTDTLDWRCPSRKDALCASSGGTLTLTSLPTSATELSAVHGRLDVVIGALHLNASF